MTAILHPGLSHFLVLSAILLAVGLFTVSTRRNAVAVLMGVELILNAAALNFVLFGRVFAQVQAQAFALFIIALAACEAVVGLAIVFVLARTSKTVLADHVDLLKG